MIKLYDLLFEVVVFPLNRIKSEFLDTDKIDRRQYEILKNAHSEIKSQLSKVSKKLGTDKIANKYVSWMLSWFVKDIINQSNADKVRDALIMYATQKDRFSSRGISLADFNKDSDIQKFLKLYDDFSKDEETSGKHVSSGNVKKLESHGIKLLGLADDYQIFNVPANLRGNRDAYNAYKKYIGKCSNPDDNTINWCTFQNFDEFNSHLGDSDGYGFFIYFNLNDPLSPYQLGWSDGHPQFTNKSNDSIL